MVCATSWHCVVAGTSASPQAPAGTAPRASSKWGGRPEPGLWRQEWGLYIGYQLRLRHHLDLVQAGSAFIDCLVLDKPLHISNACLGHGYSNSTRLMGFSWGDIN